MNFSIDICLFVFLVSTVYGNIKPVTSKDWLIEFHHKVEPDQAKRIAKRYAMVSRGPVGESHREYLIRINSNYRC